jgi:hypothetical protein
MFNLLIFFSFKHEKFSLPQKYVSRSPVFRNLLAWKHRCTCSELSSGIIPDDEGSTHL